MVDLLDLQSFSSFIDIQIFSIQMDPLVCYYSVHLQQYFIILVAIQKYTMVITGGRVGPRMDESS